MSEKLKRDLSAMLGELAAVFERVDDAAVERLVALILESAHVFAAAAGRSGMLLRCAAMRLMHLDKPAYVVGEIVTPAIAEGDLLLMVSGSGETGSLVNMARKAKDLGAAAAVITANSESALGGLADCTVRIAAPTPKAAVSDFVPSAQPMGNLFEQSAFLLLDAVIMELMDRTGKTADAMFKRHANLE
ncbi:MAG: 6-phospho-3-hexuloisomerase [Planctomycetota bacterium]|jgi:6-phospho-3-hexuloisomerase|nr:6-phospho-3-hexuloisomerase [Planctomycetota bacterium]